MRFQSARSLRVSIAIASLATTTGAARPTIAVTVDDLPAHSALPAGETRRAIADRMIAALRAAGVPRAWGFVNGAALTSDATAPGVLDAWRAAGFALGNHGWSHRGLDTLTVPQFEDEVTRGEPLLERDGDGRWFRYPFLQEGRDTARRDGARAWLAARGYRIATVTMNFDDWAWNEPYARCLARGDDRAIGWLETRYLAAAQTAARRSRRAARTAFGRDIPYVLLLHIGAFDARMAPRLLALYRTMGFGFTDLPTSEADPAYAGGEPVAAAAGEARLAPLRALPAGSDKLKARLAATCPAQG